jgi:hypothetical protein
VNERWVCKRCFADNDETNSTCQRCGLLRGAEATQADQTGWAAQHAAAAPTAAPAWQRWIRFWWIPAIVIVLVVGYLTTARRGDEGTIESGGTVNVDELRTGDCFNSDEEEISDVDGVPCDEPHAYQVFAIVTHDAATYPTDDEMSEVFRTKCVPPFETFVGADYDSSEIFGQMITPSEDSWADGDRSFVCVLYEPDPNDAAQNAVLTESLEGANR